MKKIILLIVLSIITFNLYGQEKLNIENKEYWEINNSDYDFKPLIIDTIDRCKKLDSIKIKENYIKKSNYIYNFKNNISISVGIKLADLYPSKIRLEWEKDTKTQNFTYGSLLSIYTLKYYYNGYKIEGFTRYYLVANSSGNGPFLQLRGGWGRFQNKLTNKSFNSIGTGLDIGNKFILKNNNRNYLDLFTMTTMGGIQIYNGPNGEIPIGWIWQLRFGYQF